MLGPDHVSSVKLQDLGGDNRFRAADLVGRMANVFTDLPREALQETAEFKALVCGEEIQAERKHQHPFKLRNSAKLWFSANELPRSRDRSHAFFRRWLIIPFPNQFPEGDPRRDPDLPKKLSTPESLSYLLRLAVQGLQRLVDRGEFVQTSDTARALQEYRQQCDTARAFLEEACQVAEDSAISKDQLYAAYAAWCNEAGVKPTAKAVFGKAVRGVYPTVSEDRPEIRKKRVWRWTGIQLRDDFGPCVAEGEPS